MTSITQTTDPHQGEPMEQPISEQTPISLGLVIGIGLLIVSILVAYNALDKRVSAMEEHTKTVQDDITEMKGDIKTLLRHQQ